MTDNFKINITMELGSVEFIDHGLRQDKNGNRQPVGATIIKRDERGRVTSREFHEPAVRLIYDNSFDLFNYFPFCLFSQLAKQFHRKA